MHVITYLPPNLAIPLIMRKSLMGLLDRFFTFAIRSHLFLWAIHVAVMESCSIAYHIPILFLRCNNCTITSFLHLNPYSAIIAP
jgi:hypothetical protein